jgi:hypothetical protein
MFGSFRGMRFGAFGAYYDSEPVADDERVARIIAYETNDGSTANWERYLPAARALLRKFDLREVNRISGGLFG